MFDRKPFRYFTDEEADWFDSVEKDWREKNPKLTDYQARKMFGMTMPVEAVRGGLDKETIKERADIVEVYRILHPSLQVVERGRFINAQAFCHNDKRPSLNINKEKKLFYCHSCASGSDVIGLVQRSLDESFLGALTWLDRHV